jgi:hypothetical protein
VHVCVCVRAHERAMSAERERQFKQGDATMVMASRSLAR